MARIVSLIASATEIVHALELGEFQVGRSHECDYPESVRALPVCTRPRFDVSGTSREIDRRVRATLASAASAYEVFDDLLERLQPTHIVSQTQCKACAVSRDDVERALSARFSSRPQVVALEPDSLAAIWSDILRVAGACQVEDRGRQLVAQLQHRLADIGRRAAGAPPRRVACIEWIEPLMAAGNWIPELVALLGSKCTTLDADPDAVVVMPCGFDLARTKSELYWLQPRRIRAPVFLADANQFLTRPGPRIVESLRILAEILYPERFEPSLRGTGWEPM